LRVPPDKRGGGAVHRRSSQRRLRTAGDALRLALLVAVRISDPEPSGHVGAGAAHLSDMDEFVSEQPATPVGLRRELPGAEDDVVADRVRIRRDGGRRFGGGIVGMDDDVSWVESQIPSERLGCVPAEPASGLTQRTANARRRRRAGQRVARRP
jgi:hypothetical protein